MRRVINWFGVAAGALTLVLVLVSFYYPWWQLTVGDGILKVNASPIYTNFGLLGNQFTIPLLWAFNLATIALFVASGAIMLVYSVIPTKPYAKELLGFSYKKPLYALLGFVISLAVILAVAGLVGFNVPLMGTGNLSLPSGLLSGASVSASLLAGFLFPFWLAIVVVILCVAARIYHRRISKQIDQQTQVTSPAQNTMAA